MIMRYCEDDVWRLVGEAVSHTRRINEKLDAHSHCGTAKQARMLGFL